MGTWNNKIDGNDTFQDIYQNFFDLYNQGQNPAGISKQIQDFLSKCLTTMTTVTTVYSD